MDYEPLIVKITACCPASCREDVRQDLRLEVLQIQAKADNLNGDILRKRLIGRRDRLIRKYASGGIMRGPANPKTFDLQTGSKVLDFNKNVKPLTEAKIELYTNWFYSN